MTADDLRMRFDSLIAGAEAATDEQPSASLHATCVAASALCRGIDSADVTFASKLDELGDHLLNMGGLFVNEPIVRCLLEQAKAHYCGGFHRVRELVTSDVFDDLIVQAEHLLDRGYHLPAGALAGAVLEDALRKLCGKHGVTWQGDSGISKLAIELYKAGHLAKPRHSQVETWGKLRNQIDHGDFSKPGDVDKQDVRRMVDGVRDFVARFLG